MSTLDAVLGALASMDLQAPDEPESNQSSQPGFITKRTVRYVFDNGHAAPYKLDLDVGPTHTADHQIQIEGFCSDCSYELQKQGLLFTMKETQAMFPLLKWHYDFLMANPTARMLEAWIVLEASGTPVPHLDAFRKDVGELLVHCAQGGFLFDSVPSHRQADLQILSYLFNGNRNVRRLPADVLSKFSAAIMILDDARRVIGSDPANFLLAKIKEEGCQAAVVDLAEQVAQMSLKR